MLMQFRQSKTDNGIRVVTATMGHVQSVALGIWVGIGSRYEPDHVSGISHFTEHLLFKGTRRRSQRDISQTIEGRGGYLNAFTGEEATCYYARVDCNQLRQGLDVLTDMYVNSRFDKTEIEKERGVIMEEIMMYHDQPRHLVSEMLMNILWKNHPVGRPIIGTRETLSAMKRKTFLDFTDKNYVAKNTVVAMAGNVEHDACVDYVQDMMRKVPGKQRAPAFTAVNASVHQGRTAFLEKNVEQTHLALGLRSFGYEDKRRHTLRILNAILGENMSSRLFQIVREKHGLAYSVHSSIQLFRDSGALMIAAGLDRERTVKALDLIVNELVRIKERPVSKAELQRAKDYAIGQMRLGLESTSHQMMWLGDNLLSRGKFTPPEETIELLSRVTVDDVAKLASQLMKHSKVSLAIVSPDVSKQDQAQMKSILRRL
jgi:predicted Zn-dependent peptidase